jgi:hypothetical protein
MILVIGLWTFLRAWLLGSAVVALENVALRHQLLILQRSVGRPRLSRWDRILWIWLARVWTGWRSSLVIVQPATVLAWHRQGFRLYWRWRSRPRAVGRPKLAAEIRHLIRQMARDNPTWGRRRIQAELALLGYDVADVTVAKYMHGASPHPSPTWRTYVGDPGKWRAGPDPSRACRRLLVEAREEAVEELLAADLALAFGVVALLLKRGTEGDRGDEEGAGLTDGLEVAIHLDGPGAVAVAEHAPVHLDAEATHLSAFVGRRELTRLMVQGFDLLGDLEVLISDGLVGNARIGHGHGEGLVAE